MIPLPAGLRCVYLPGGRVKSTANADYALFKVHKSLRLSANTSPGIERAELQAFRHMAASEMIENGVAPSVVQRQMRHNDSRITLQKYAHVIGDAQRRAVDSLARSVLELTR